MKMGVAAKRKEENDEDRNISCQMRSLVFVKEEFHYNSDTPLARINVVNHRQPQTRVSSHSIFIGRRRKVVGGWNLYKNMGHLHRNGSTFTEVSRRQ